jgi:hypothetical protein
MADESNSLNNFQKIIRLLQDQRALIDNAIQSVMAASGAFLPAGEGEGAPGTPFLATGSADSQPVELPRGALLNKSLPAAIKLYLHAVKQKQTIRQIATALRDGGVESTSPNFEGVVTGCLNRLKSNGEVLRFKDGWALAEFYPENLRVRLSQAKNKAKPKGKKSKKSKKAANAVPENREKSSAGKGLQERIENYVQVDHKGNWVSTSEVAKALGVDLRPLPLAMGRLAKKHGWEKGGEGRYRSPIRQVI